MLAADEVRGYLSGVERQDGQLRRGTTNEAGEKQEVFGLGERKRLSRLIACEPAEGQAGIDLEPGPRSRR